MVKVCFLGSGNATSDEYGNSSCVVEQGDSHLVIDFGPTAYHVYRAQYPNRYPDAIFITHTHFDHIGSLENLFFDAYFNANKLIKIYAPAALVSSLHKRMESSECQVAEGGANFWDAFQLVPVSDYFWFNDTKYQVFENRHHSLGFSFGLLYPGLFLFTGDTKPIPEVINTLAPNNELIFHDLSVNDQPSHTTIDDLKAYKGSVIDRCYFYHLNSSICVNKAITEGLNIVVKGDEFIFSNSRKNETGQIKQLKTA